MNNSMGDEALNVPKRPIRLWLAGILNICIGGLSVALVAFLATSGRVPEQLQLSANAALLSSLAGAFLLLSSVVALMGRPSGRRLMYLGAFCFFWPPYCPERIGPSIGKSNRRAYAKVGGQCVSSLNISSIQRVGFA